MLWGWAVTVFDFYGFETAALTVSSCGDVTETLWDFMDHG